MEDSNVVTFVISRNIKPGYEKEYDDWLRRYLTIERKAPGYLGTTIIMPGGTKSAIRYIIQRYEDKASMTAWKDSQQSLNLIEEATITLYRITSRRRAWKHGLLYQT